MAGDEWFETLFGTTWLEIAKGVPPERTLQEVDFISETLGLPNGAAILDLACGFGRHTVPLARRGYRISGVDLSEASLEAAREAARQAGVEIDFQGRDMRELEFNGEFDAVINIFTAFGYFKDKSDDEAVIRAVRSSLRPRGAFLIDVINQPALMGNYEWQGWQRTGDGSVWLDDRNYDAKTGRNEVTHTVIHPDGSRETFEHSVRLYTYPELAEMLGSAGLGIERSFGDFDGSDYSMESPRMILLSRRD